MLADNPSVGRAVTIYMKMDFISRLISTPLTLPRKAALFWLLQSLGNRNYHKIIYDDYHTLSLRVRITVLIDNPALRTVTSAVLHEITITGIPAYRATNVQVAMRHLENYRNSSALNSLGYELDLAKYKTEVRGC